MLNNNIDQNKFGERETRIGTCDRVVDKLENQNTFQRTQTSEIVLKSHIRVQTQY